MVREVEEKIIKCEVYLNSIYFPKKVRKVKNNEYAIFSADLDKVIEDNNKLLNDCCLIKLKGNVCTLETGIKYKVYAKLKDVHPEYGNTYEIIYINRIVDLSTVNTQRIFLSTILSDTLVDNLFEKYDNVIELLDNKDVKKLIKVKGIKTKKALKLITEYENSKDYSAIYLELGKLGLTTNFVKTLLDHYKSPDIVIDTIKNNPYSLVEIKGVGFKKADDIAIKMGLNEQSVERIYAFFYYHLEQQAELGKSYILYDELNQALYNNLGNVSIDIVNKAAKKMIDDNKVVCIDDTKIALTKYYNLEQNICTQLLRLFTKDDSYENMSSSELQAVCKVQVNVPSDWKDIIKTVELKQGFDYTDEQKNAFKLITDNNVLAITGSAGSGKSSTANGICEIFKNYRIACCALSGKAAVRITEITGLPSSTIHKLLEYQNGEFLRNSYNKLEYDVILIDEATMNSGTLFLSLLKSIPTGAKVLLLGDVQQLTPIGNCQVYADILNANVLPIVKLTKLHRQALKSAIITHSKEIAEQKQIFNTKYNGVTVLGELQDLELDITKDKNENSSNKVIKYFQRELKKYNNILDVQVCVPMKLKGNLSCYNLNNLLQNICNPKFNNSKEIDVILEFNKKTKKVTKRYFLRVGDKVINMTNNYKTLNENGEETAVYNGNIGIIKEIDEDSGCIIDFIGIGKLYFDKSMCKNLRLGYACTIHKLQGSGFKSVIVAIDNGSHIMHNCELLYTGMTRAEKHCTIVGLNSAIRHCISTKEKKNKQTFLRDLLIQNKKNS